jgi:hypothetical protein
MNREIEKLENIREEIRDLRLYLEGLPKDLRRGSAFLAYERRLAELSRDLLLLDLNLFSGSSTSTEQSVEAVYADVGERLQMMERECRRHANRLAFTSQAMNWALLASSASSVASLGLATTILTPLGFGIVTAGLAATLSFVGFTNKLRKRERLVEDIANLRESLARSFDSSGNILALGDFYSNKVDQFEFLIHSIESALGPGTMKQARGALDFVRSIRSVSKS